MMNKILLTSALALALASCKTAAPAKSSEPALTRPVDTQAPVENHALMRSLNKNSVFEQVKINSKIDVQTGSYLPTADATIYIENGSKIWMNLSAAFLNVARGIATPGGIKGYEKIGKTYIESDFSYLNKLLNVNFINYSSFQNMLVGKPFLPVAAADYIITKNAGGFSFSSRQNQNITVDGKTSEYKINLDYTPDYDLSRIQLQDIRTADNLEVYYSNWTAAGSDRFPQNVKIILKGQKTGQILIENTKFDFSKMDAPYSVPANYTKKEIR